MTENNRIIDNNEIGGLATKAVNMFIDSNTRSVIKFCSTPSLKPQAFYRCIEYVKQNNPDLYKKYVIKVSNIKEDKYDAIINEVSKIMALIKTSEIDDTKHFDVLDYFLTTGLSPHMFVNIVKVIYDSHDIMLVKKMFGNIIDNPVFINKYSAINGKLVFEKYFDNGDAYEVPKEAKEEVIAFLESRYIPLYQSVYSVALKRYLKGDPLISSVINEIENNNVK
jgi:hypothetical protein